MDAVSQTRPLTHASFFPKPATAGSHQRGQLQHSPPVYRAVRPASHSDRTAHLTTSLPGADTGWEEDPLFPAAQGIAPAAKGQTAQEQRPGQVGYCPTGLRDSDRSSCLAHIHDGQRKGLPGDGRQRLNGR